METVVFNQKRGKLTDFFRLKSFFCDRVARQAPNANHFKMASTGFKLLARSKLQEKRKKSEQKPEKKCL